MPSARISCFIDTNILIYPRDGKAPKKQAAASSWILALAAADALVISPQVVNEYCNVILRKYPQTPLNDLQEAVERMRGWCRAGTTYANALGALELRRTMLGSHYDAVLLSSALLHGCTHFLSEDLQHDRLIGDMRVVNPFLTAPDAVLTA